MTRQGMQTRCYNPYLEQGDMQIKRAAQTQISSILRGTVVDNADPLNIGRLKVRVNGVYNGILDEDLPWCMPNSIAASNNSGTFIIPEVNNTVWVIFEDGEKFRPVWLGCAYSTNTTSSRQIGNTNGQKRSRIVGQTESPQEGWSLEQKVVYKSPSGSVFYMDETENGDSIVLRESGGSSLKIGSGFIKLETAAGLTVNIEDAEGTVQIGVADSMISMDCLNNKLKLKIDKAKLDVSEDKVNVELGDTKCSLTKTGFTIKDKNNSVISNGNNLKLTGEGASIQLLGSTVNINAGTINMRADTINRYTK